jgi:hypothetical protein
MTIGGITKGVGGNAKGVGGIEAVAGMVATTGLRWI